ncbi:alginate lyase family protein [Streptomyces sp. NPDC096311]|uniref:alginate lyase family protein n=1 Tax=Streptomyces sp. NPDC096311 TaxID=3366083 RepID=UPI003830532D
MRHARSGLLARRQPRTYLAGVTAIAVLLALYAWLGRPTPGAGAATSTAATAVDVAPAKFAHPGITFDKADLVRLKGNLKREPWKSSYQSLLSDSRSSLDYVMQGPFAEVGRNRDVNRGAYENDMQAVYNLTLRGYLSGQKTYSAKATKVMTAWCGTQKKWSGAEAAFTIGDYSVLSIAAADVLRSTYSGWTAADTRLCQKNFNDVYWPWLGVGNGTSGSGSHLLSANQGALALQGAMAIAVFNDDRVKFDEVVNAYRTDPLGGLPDTLANGEMGDTGRDGGHAYGQLMHYAAVAETAWKQGVDLYSDQNNRLLKASEYFSRFNLGGNPVFVRFGSSYGLYKSIAQDSGGARWLPRAEAIDMIYNAYVVRKGLKAPYTTEIRAKIGESYTSMIYRRSSDTTKATLPPAAWKQPAASAVTSLTGKDVGTVGAAGSSSYAGGTWTLKTSGRDQLAGYHYAYRKVTGDATIVARVNSTGSAGQATAGLMIRPSLDTRDDVPYVFQRLMNQGYLQSYWSGSKGSGSYWGNYTNLPDVKGPYWLKLVRRGDSVYTYSSPNGNDWSPTANVLLPSLPNTVYLGLAATSGDTAVTNNVTFDHVAIGTGPSSKVSAPTGLTATAAPGKVTLRWKAPARAVSYTVLRATSKSGTYSRLATDVYGTTYTNKSAKHGQRYYYKIEAAGYAELSGACAAVAATP